MDDGLWQLFDAERQKFLLLRDLWYRERKETNRNRGNSKAPRSNPVVSASSFTSDGKAAAYTPISERVAKPLSGPSETERTKRDLVYRMEQLSSAEDLKSKVAEAKTLRNGWNDIPKEFTPLAGNLAMQFRRAEDAFWLKVKATSSK